MDLAEFLLARIAEDEAEAQRARERNLPFWVAQEMGRSGGDLGVGYIDRFGPARVLAECEAKRRIVGSRTAISLPSKEIHDEVQRQREYVWKLLALPYADRPDYREEWKP